MTTLVRIHRKGQMTLPTRLRALAGIAEGDLVEAAFQRGKIVLTPKLVIDRSKFPTAGDEYTPEQRKIIDAQLAEGLAEIRAGQTVGPFKNGGEIAAFLKKRKLDARRTKLTKAR